MVENRVYDLFLYACIKLVISCANFCDLLVHDLNVKFGQCWYEDMMYLC
jgi:hypothetical protein